ncbi:MAG: 50S ribosomal protein L3 [Planctomycetes bacterium]|nr:50S ribosomal protein L3 [Planctomycetota bacterium]
MTTTAATRSKRKALLGRKIGMTQAYREDGKWVPITVLEVGPCTVLQVKTPETDGYAAIQVGFGETLKAAAWPQQKLFQKVKTRTKKFVQEIPPVEAATVYRAPLFSEVGGTVEYLHLTPGGNLIEKKVPRTKLILRAVKSQPAAAPVEGKESEAAPAGGQEPAAPQAPDAPSAALAVKNMSGSVLKEYALPPGSSIEVANGATVADGDLLAYVVVKEPVAQVSPGCQIGVGLFTGTGRVDVSGITKGKGFQGCIKRHHFNAGPKSHGSKNLREPGSTGMHTEPGRVLPGKRMPGHLGAAKRKARNLKVLQIDPEDNLMLVTGSVPGPNGGFVYIEESLKKK